VSSPLPLKHEQVALRLATEIRTGQLSAGARLPGEIELARRFEVSRGTMRSALAQLSDEGLVATRMGKGSFVTFDGRPLDAQLGWARALHSQGIDSSARVVKLALERDSGLAGQLGLADDAFVVVERLRTLQRDAGAISFERSHVPATDELLTLPETGLESGSLTAALARSGLVADHGRQRLGARVLTPEEATLLGRRRKTWFIETTRTSWTVDSGFVEHVVSLLDPQHFQLELEFGD
jgi:GntR family transcriptional regulator